MRRTGLFFIIQLFFFLQIHAQSSIDHWEMILKAEDTWKYLVGNIAPPNNWHEKDFDDSSWNTGAGGFGYSDSDDGTVINSTPSVYLRIRFTIENLSKIEKVVLLCDYDDAFVAYLNGKEIGRSGISGNPPSYDQYADIDHEALLYQGLYPEELIIAKSLLGNYLAAGENTLAIQVHNINATSSDMSSNFYLAAGLNVSTNIYQPVTSWFHEPLEYNSSNLPIVKINTNGQGIPDEPKIMATMGIIDNGPGLINHVDDPITGYNGNIGIEIRGSSSQMFPKKQYAVELWTATGQDTSASVLGLPAEEDWILYAPYSDKSLLRNVLAYKFSRDLGWYAPRTKLVELYLNEQYKGVYVFTEKIKRDKNRVDINTLNPDENSGDDLTGGYIVKIDKETGASETSGWDSPFFPPNRSQNQRIHFLFHYPKPEEITFQQKQYIENYITEFEESLAGAFWDHPEFGYQNYINVESYIDYSIVNEISKNVDGYRLSTFLYKDKDSRDGKLYLGPVWDFNLGFGNADYCDGGTTQGWAWDFNLQCNGDGWLIPFWWEKLLHDQEYKMQYKARWQEVRAGELSNESIMNYIDSVVSVLDEPQRRNFEQWPILDEYIWPNNYVGGSYASEIQYLKNWISNRLSWLDSKIDNFRIITDLEESLISRNAITVFPNPGDGTLNIRFEEMPSGHFHLTMHNQLGEEILNKNLKGSQLSENTLSINELQNQLNSGVYVLRLSTDENNFFTEKVVVR